MIVVTRGKAPADLVGEMGARTHAHARNAHDAHDAQDSSRAKSAQGTCYSQTMKSLPFTGAPVMQRYGEGNASWAMQEMASLGGAGARIHARIICAPPPWYYMLICIYIYIYMCVCKGAGSLRSFPLDNY